MDLLKMIADLRQERAAIDDALVVLERLAQSHGGKRRGRPPAWMAAQRLVASAGAQHREKKSPTLSIEVRKKMAEAQKRRWEAYRKAKGESA
jgi:hypothetical protein